MNTNKHLPKYVTTEPDPRYKDTLVTRFVNNIMRDGKKEKAYKLVYEAFDKIAEKTGEDPVEVWKKALGNVMPTLEVSSRRIGGATFQIPSEVRPDRKVSLGMKWMILFTRKRPGTRFAEKLAAEIMAAANNEGGSVKKKEDTHKMAEANKAFSHFRF
jgi:small subunit ribosomal protein S7